LKVLLFCTANLTTGSGSEVRARLMSEGLARNGADVHVVASGIPAGFASLGIGGTLLAPGRPWEETLSAAADAFRPDILYGITEAGADALMRTARAARRPVAYDLHGIGFIEVIELGRVYGSRLKRIRNSLRWLSRIPGADAVTVANPGLYPVVKMFNGKAVPVFGMTDVSHFRPDGPAVRLGTDPGKIQVLFAGNWFKWQGVDMLLEAIGILARDREPFEFHLVGSVGKRPGPEPPAAGDPARGAVHYRDSVDYADVPGYYRGADVLVIPRPFMLSTHLAFPQKLVDYMASGRTVVATDLAPHRFALESPPAGILCHRTARALADAIRTTKDERLRAELSANARSQAVALFCHRKQTERVRQLFSGILSGR